MSTSPIFFKESENTEEGLKDLIKNKKPRIIDIYQDQLGELFEVCYPAKTQKSDFKESSEFKKFVDLKTERGGGTWVYYPWSNRLIRIVNQNDLQSLTTSRNKLLITQEEQQKLQESKMYVFGLSVGNSIATTLAHTGMGSNYILADPDVYSTTNMNRVRIGLHHVGSSKSQVTAEQIYEINPYINITLHEDGINESKLLPHIKHSDNAVFFDEMDDFYMKLQVRKIAQKRKIPVIMMSALGDNLLIDIERYDIDPQLEPFNGLSRDLVKDLEKKRSFSTEEAKKLAKDIVGAENIPVRALESLKEIGRTLVGRPQLFSTVTLEGGFAAYIAREIILNKPVSSGRYFLSLSSTIGMGQKDMFSTEQRNKSSRKNSNA